MSNTASSPFVRSAAIAAALMLGACAPSGGGGTGGDPGARALPAGSSCQSVRAEMDKLIARGVQPKVEALSSGRKMSPGDRADAERYNGLLAQYLGARCHQ